MFTNRFACSVAIAVSLVTGALAQSPLDVMPPIQPNPYVPFPHIITPSFDESRNGYGIAQRLTRADGLQGRVLWIDATANLERINTVEKIDGLSANIYYKSVLLRRPKTSTLRVKVETPPPDDNPSSASMFY